MAVLLILSSIAIACFQVVSIQTVDSGVRWYIAQAFLLAGSIFGLEYYIKVLTRLLNKNDSNKENTQRDKK